MENFYQFISLFLHLDQHLQWILENYGTLTYILLFLIVFCETGLVVTPFLPGDSLLFVAGAFCATGHLDIFLLGALLLVAAIIGDTVNYHIGRHLGQRALKLNNRFLKPTYFEQTQDFYKKYGSFTIVVARFVPIVRTFAPFIAGVGKMNYQRFITFNVVGGFVWVTGLMGLGYFFGNLPFVKKNLSAVILFIIFLSILPMIYQFIMVKLKSIKNLKSNRVEMI
jgi:membrane-associated protein